MFKVLAALAATAALSLAATGVKAADHKGVFINGGVGGTYYQLTTDGYDNGHNTGTGGQINLGWRGGALGLELGYVDFGKSESTDDFGDYAKFTGDGVTLGLNARFNPVSRWYLEFRGGLLRWSIKTDATIQNYDYYYGPYSMNISATQTGTSWYAGFGTGADLSKHWAIGGRIDVYDMRLDDSNGDSHVYTVMTSVNFEYRF